MFKISNIKNEKINVDFVNNGSHNFSINKTNKFKNLFFDISGKEMYVLVDCNVEKRFIDLAGIAETNSKYRKVDSSAFNSMGKINERKPDGKLEVIKYFSTLLEEDKPLSKYHEMRRYNGL